MTIPRGFQNVSQRVSEMVMGMVPKFRQSFSKDETELAVHIRGNESLYNSLANLIKSRIEGRAHLPLPSNPLDCHSSMARDRELQWLLSRLEFIYHSPARQEAERTGEQPAA